MSEATKVEESSAKAERSAEPPVQRAEGSEQLPAEILALQQGAGNAAAHQLLARDPKKKQGTVSTDALPQVSVAWQPATAYGKNTDELFWQLEDGLRFLPTSETGIWAMLIVFGERLYVYDGAGKVHGKFKLLGSARVPVNGFYFSKYAPPEVGATGAAATSSWSAMKLGTAAGGNAAWLPWVFGTKENPGDIYIDDWVSADDRPKLSALLNTATRYGLVVTGFSGGKRTGAQNQVTRVQEKLNKAKEKGKGAGGEGGEGDTEDQPDALKVLDTALGLLIRVFANGAKDDIDYREGESDEDLLNRIKQMVRKLRDDTNPARSTRMENGATRTGFDQRAGRGEIPIDPAMLGKEGDFVRRVNAHAYPAEIISYGPVGNEEAAKRASAGVRKAGPTAPEKKQTEVTVTGATLDFEMHLYYELASHGLLDEATNRMQPFSYKWELIDISHADLAQAASLVASKGTPIQSGGQELKVSDTESGISRNMARDFSNTWTDTKADLDDLSHNTALLMNPYAALGWLGVIAISDLVQVGGTLISSYFALVSQPSNHRSIGFSREGLFLLRCFAQPVDSEKTIERITELGGTPMIRATSVDVLPVRVMNINKRAEDAQEAEQREIDALKAKLDDPTLMESQAEIRAKIDDRTAALEDNLFETAERQIRVADVELERITRWRTTSEVCADPELLDQDLRVWRAKLDVQGVDLWDYEKNLKEARAKLVQQRTRFSEGFGVAGMKGRVLRPKMTLASESTGQVFTLLANLGEGTESREGARVWRLTDLTSPDTQDKYVGRGATHQAAILSAFQDFRGRCEYGRGSLSVRLPADQLKQLTGETITLPDGGMFRVEPGSGSRFWTRLKDLATAAEMVGLVVGGPIGVAVGMAGAVAGGLVAAENMRRRAAAERLKPDFQTAMDILGVVGAFVAVGGLASRGLAGRFAKGAMLADDAAKAAKLTRYAARVEVVAEYLHIAGTGLMKGQLIIIPVTLGIQLGKIEEEESKDPNANPARYRAKRLEAWASALKSGVVTVRSMQMAKDPNAGWDPLASSKKPPTPVAPEGQRPPGHPDAAPTPRPEDMAPAPEAKKPPPVHENPPPVVDLPPVAPPPEGGPVVPGRKPPTPVPEVAPGSTPAPEPLRTTVEKTGDVPPGKGEQLIKDVGGWRSGLKEFVDKLPADKQAAAGAALSEARATMLKEEIAKVKEQFGVEGFDVGSAGFKSDIDVTLMPLKGDKRSVGEQIKASAEAAEALNRSMRERLGGDPEHIADIAVHGYTGENVSLKPKGRTAESAAWMEGQQSMAEMRRSMTQSEWAAYKEGMLTELGQSGDPQQARDMRKMMAAGEKFHGRMQAELDAAMVKTDPAATRGERATAARDALLLSKRRRLGELFDAKPRDLLAIKQLQAEIRYFAPGAYLGEAAFHQAVKFGQARKSAGKESAKRYGRDAPTRGEVNQAMKLSWAQERGLTPAQRRSRLAAVAESNNAMYRGHEGEGGPLDQAKDAAKYAGRIHEALELMGVGDTTAVGEAVNAFRASKLADGPATQAALERYRFVMKLDPNMPLDQVAVVFKDHAAQWMNQAAQRARMIERTAEGAVRPPTGTPEPAATPKPPVAPVAPVAPAAPAAPVTPPVISGGADPRTAGRGGITAINERIRPHDTDPNSNITEVEIIGRLQQPIPRDVAPNYNRDDMWGILRDEHGLADWQAAHLWGPGFGDEAAAGIMLAPSDVNLIWQNQKVESFIRDLQRMAASQGAWVELRAVAQSHARTMAGGAALAHVQYEFTLVSPGGQRTSAGRVAFSVGAPPNGVVTGVVVQ